MGLMITTGTSLLLVYSGIAAAELTMARFAARDGPSCSAANLEVQPVEADPEEPDDIG